MLCMCFTILKSLKLSAYRFSGGDDIEENIPEEWTTFKVNRSAMLIVIMIVFVLSVCKIIMHETNARKCQSKENTVCLRLANCKCCARFSPHPFRSLP